MTTPHTHIFHVTNWFQWCLDARDAGFSQADMRFILNTVGVMDAMRAALKADEKRKPATVHENEVTG